MQDTRFLSPKILALCGDAPVYWLHPTHPRGPSCAFSLLALMPTRPATLGCRPRRSVVVCGRLWPSVVGGRLWRTRVGYSVVDLHLRDSRSNPVSIFQIQGELSDTMLFFPRVCDRFPRRACQRCDMCKRFCLPPCRRVSLRSRRHRFHISRTYSAFTERLSSRK